MHLNDNVVVAEDFQESDPLKPDINTNDTIQSLSVNEIKDGKTTFRNKIKNVFNNITVEPVVFLMVLPAVFTINTSQNLSIQKACQVNLNISAEICTSLSNNNTSESHEIELQVQKLVAMAQSYKTYLTATIPSFVALLVGSWSDRSGRRKVFLYFPVSGQLLLSVLCLVNVYFFNKTGLYTLVLSEALIEGFSGSWCVILATCFSYIGVITSNENRTFRLGIVNFCLTVAFPIGMALSGIVLKKFGFSGSYFIILILAILNLIYISLFVKDPPKTKIQEDYPGGCYNFLRTFFDFSNLKDTFRIVFKKGSNHRRLRMWVFLFVVTILFGTMIGENSVMYLSTRNRFNWNEVTFSIFQTYNSITHTFGTIVSIVVFSKYLKWHDSVLGINSTVGKIAASFVYAFAKNQYIFALAPLVEIMNGTATLSMRSLGSKLVEPDELGKLNAIFGLSEHIMPLLYVPMYTKVYIATIHTLPGTIFLMSAALLTPVTVVFICLFIEHLRLERKARKEVTTLE